MYMDLKFRTDVGFKSYVSLKCSIVWGGVIIFFQVLHYRSQQYVNLHNYFPQASHVTLVWKNLKMISNHLLHWQLDREILKCIHLFLKWHVGEMWIRGKWTLLIIIHFYSYNSTT
jgi:hypothetical protein